MGVGEWTRGPAIGRGSSATVSLAVDRRTGDVFAVKSVGAAQAGELRREQSILCGLSSPYVVRCLGSDVSTAEDGSGGAWYDMFMEYAPGGSLADEIKRCGGRCEERLIRSRARDILLGLAHVHTAGVVHCDVKGRNVLIGTDGRAMIADFGCARRVAEDLGGIAGEQLRGGTPMFMAPEAARGEEQGPAADIWALGCTVIEMATGGAPWPRFADPVATLHHVAFSGEVPEFPRWLSEEAKDFLARCLQRDPRERWTAEQLLEHQFVAASYSSSSSVPRITEKEMFVSPKSVLDQALWDDTTADTDGTAGPTDRVRALAAGAAVVPDWTWDANWITVHSGSGGDNERAMSPEPEVDTDSDSDSPVGSSAGSVTDAGARHASRAHGNSCGDVSLCNDEYRDSFCDYNHVISDCNLAVTSNGFFPRCSVTFSSFLCAPSVRLSCACCYSCLLFFPGRLRAPDWLAHIAKMHIRARWRVFFFFWSCVTRDLQLGGCGYTLRYVRKWGNRRSNEPATWGVRARRRPWRDRPAVGGARDVPIARSTGHRPLRSTPPSVTGTLVLRRTFGTRAESHRRLAFDHAVR